jgi:hypothetical protein
MNSFLPLDAAGSCSLLLRRLDEPLGIAFFSIILLHGPRMWHEIDEPLAPGPAEACPLDAFILVLYVFERTCMSSLGDISVILVNDWDFPL